MQPSNMDFPQKIDVIDMIIDVLKDHEKKLDEISYRLDKAVSIIERHAMRARS